MDFTVIAGVFVTFFLLFFLFAVIRNQRKKRSEVETCAALYPGTSLNSLQKRDECVTRKSMARRVAYRSSF